VESTSEGKKSVEAPQEEEKKNTKKKGNRIFFVSEEYGPIA
jgi:ASC-1-like (ASCH) protein